MNLPNSILGQPLSAIGLVFGRVPYIQNALPITVMTGVSFWVLPMRSDRFSVRQKTMAAVLEWGAAKTEWAPVLGEAAEWVAAL
jgi:hypothetical protein